MDNFENRTPDEQPEEKEVKKETQAAPKVEQQKYYTEGNPYGQQYRRPEYDQQQYRQPQYGAPQYASVPRQSGIPTWLKVILIIALIFVLIGFMFTSCIRNLSNSMNGLVSEDFLMEGEGTSVSDITGEYVAVLHIEDEISQSSSFWYDHYYLLDTIDDLIADDTNQGIIFYMDTPGGSVYATDEMYLAVKKYQETTKRPVYTYMASMAASGGYYIAAPSDKIYINRNGITGSIGVTMGSYIDVSELLAKYGVKVNTITSGPNKAIGSELVPMTDEQRAILQSIVDEAYEQFTGIVAEGRGMDIARVKELADGRIYTALQAKENGLVDEVGTYEDLCDAFMADNSLDASVQIVDFWPPQMSEFDSFLSRFMSTGITSGGMLTADQIEELLSLNGKVELKYMYGE
ncbi:MAG: signal peptide peptidase SppA [Clostridia bacterium]|nr:signal peptide peptidase SppA [Clostridia bacterium]